MSEPAQVVDELPPAGEPAARRPVPAGAWRDLRRTALAGFAFGALLYGAPIALVHVLHNRVGSLRDALAAYVDFLALYGLWALAIFVVGWALAAGWARRPSRLQAAPGRSESTPGSAPRGAFLGLALFNLIFWEIYFLYGLTYDQAPFGPPAGAWGMVALLAGLALAIALAVGVGSWALFRAGERLRRGGLLGRLALAAFLVGALVHLAAPLLIGSPAPAPLAPPAATLAPAAAVDTGLSVVFVGLDGADWRVARPMMRRGELPVFASLVRRGASADLTTIHDSNSAVIWASIYTGARPEVHGALDFYRVHLPGMASDGLFPVHRTYFKELADVAAAFGLARRTTVDRGSLALPPLWEIADDAGLSIGVVDGYFYSFPALAPKLPGSFFLSDGLDSMAPGKPARHAELLAQPPSLFREVRPLLDRGDFGWQSAVLLDLLAKGPQPRFLNLYTHEPDSVQHWFWKWHEPERFLGVRQADLARNGDRVRAMYRSFDAFLGRLAAAVGPQTVIVVASDHGHSPTLVHSMYTQHRHGPPGILMMAGGPVRPGALAADTADIYDLEPTILYLLGLPVPRDAAGRVLTGALDPAWASRHPVRTVPSYRGLPPSPGLPFVRGDSDRSRQEIEKLKALGYI